MSFEIHFDGLSAFTKHLEGLADFAKALEGEIATVHFNPSDPESVENAVRGMQGEIDGRLLKFRDNPTAVALA